MNLTWGERDVLGRFPRSSHDIAIDPVGERYNANGSGTNANRNPFSIPKYRRRGTESPGNCIVEFMGIVGPGYYLGRFENVLQVFEISLIRF